MASPLPFSEACERNKEPILAVLRTAFASCRSVLEIGSGTGQHAVHFAAAMPHLVWQPTERAGHLAGLDARIARSGLPNLRGATELDVSQPDWSAESPDGVYTANTLHIMSWREVIALFAGVARIIQPGGTVCIYGPFSYEGRHTAPSNEQFNDWLQARDPASGIRDLSAVRGVAAAHGFTVTQDLELPANNRLVLLKSAD